MSVCKRLFSFTTRSYYSHPIPHKPCRYNKGATDAVMEDYLTEKKWRRPEKENDAAIGLAAK